MRLLFVENRYTTWLYAGVAKALSAEGHEIHWLVQNHRFAPRFGTVHRLPYPQRGEAQPGLEAYAWLRGTDRGILHFAGSDVHYAVYDQRISAILTSVAPSVVFGEATQFHELLTLSRCRELGIPYLAPTSTRYPSGRMCFFAYDTLEPVGGQGGAMDAEAALALVRAIAAREVVPSYMRQAPRKPWRRRIALRAEGLRIVAGWVGGERFITPSPLRKWNLKRRQAAAVSNWEAKAHASLPSSLIPGKWVLYPLQMQPEANIDVWGRPWNDQAEIVRRAARSLASVGAHLVVKPNPKSKYEMDAKLSRVLDECPNVVPLSHHVSMAEIFHEVPMVLTVTGTVLMECIFSGKPVAALGNHAMTRYPGVHALATPEEVGGTLERVVSGDLKGATEGEAVALIRYLDRTSYSAEYFNPLAHPEKLEPRQLHPLVNAFLNLLQKTAANDIQPHPFSAPRP